MNIKIIKFICLVVLVPVLIFGTHAFANYASDITTQKPSPTPTPIPTATPVVPSGSGNAPAGGMPKAPSVITKAASNIDQVGAFLNASIIPYSADTIGWFEWGTTANLGFATQSRLVALANFNTPTPFTDFLIGLSPGTIYYFRAAARNIAGTTYGDILSFVTLGGITSANANGSSGAGASPNNPKEIYVATDQPSNIGPNGAILHGLVTAPVSGSTVWFEWGPTQSLGSASPVQPILGTTPNTPFAYLLLNLTRTPYFRHKGRYSDTFV